MKKRILTILLCVILVVWLTGCGKKTQNVLEDSKDNTDYTSNDSNLDSYPDEKIYDSEVDDNSITSKDTQTTKTETSSTQNKETTTSKSDTSSIQNKETSASKSDTSSTQNKETSTSKTETSSTQNKETTTESDTSSTQDKETSTSKPDANNTSSEEKSESNNDKELDYNSKNNKSEAEIFCEKSRHNDFYDLLSKEDKNNAVSEILRICDKYDFNCITGTERIWVRRSNESNIGLIDYDGQISSVCVTQKFEVMAESASFKYNDKEAMCMYSDDNGLGCFYNDYRYTQISVEELNSIDPSIIDNLMEYYNKLYIIAKEYEMGKFSASYLFTQFSY